MRDEFGLEVAHQFRSASDNDYLEHLRGGKQLSQAIRQINALLAEPVHRHVRAAAYRPLTWRTLAITPGPEAYSEKKKRLIRPKKYDLFRTIEFGMYLVGVPAPKGAGTARPAIEHGALVLVFLIRGSQVQVLQGVANKILNGPNTKVTDCTKT